MQLDKTLKAPNGALAPQASTSDFWTFLISGSCEALNVIVRSSAATAGDTANAKAAPAATRLLQLNQEGAC